MKYPLLLSCWLAFWAGPAFGQQVAFRPGREASVGVLASYQVVGVQADYRFAQSWGLKLAGARQFSSDRADEYGLAGIGLLTYYPSIGSKLVEPVVGLGAVRSVYHWAQMGRSGNVVDWNVGGGLGTNFRFNNRFRTGLNVFVFNGFRASYTAGDMVITGRRLLIFPALTFDVLL